MAPVDAAVDRGPHQANVVTENTGAQTKYIELSLEACGLWLSCICQTLLLLGGLAPISIFSSNFSIFAWQHNVLAGGAYNTLEANNRLTQKDTKVLRGLWFGFRAIDAIAQDWLNHPQAP